jgi:hypothetical protein
MPSVSNTIVGVDFGAPRRARDQRRKIIAIAAHPIDWRRYRIDIAPDGDWMKQIARNLLDPVDGFLRNARCLIHVGTLCSRRRGRRSSRATA